MRNSYLLAALSAGFILTGVSPSLAESSDLPFLHPLFTDNMVLQRDRQDDMWGWTTPGATVTVKIDGSTSTAVAGTDGKWVAKLPAKKAGGPYTIDISGPRTVELKNVLFGDVWICSGQSNMQFGVGNLANASEEIAKSNHPNIRLFMVPNVTSATPVDLVKGSWSECNPTNIVKDGWGGFSAVGYFFGRDLERDVHVPIGLLETTWGGTPAEAWVSAPALKTMTDYATVDDMVKRDVDASKHSGEELSTRSDQWVADNDKLSQATPNPSDPAFDDSGWKKMSLPGAWEGSGLPDFDGVVWYRRSFDLSKEMITKDIALHLGPIDDRDTTWVNGVLVGHSTSYDRPRDYTIPASSLREGKNVIAIRVLDTGGGGGLYGSPDQLSLGLSSGGNISLTGPWSYIASTTLSSMPSNVPGAGGVQLQNTPTMLYNAMVAPLIPFGVKGAIWYQGEANAGRGEQYQTLLPTLIKDWRSRWGEGDFPFLIVQLANFMQTQSEPTDEAWARLREAQSMTARNVTNAGEAVTIDIGDAFDIHPKNKQDVGRRLELVALAKTYGQKVEYSGPAFASMDENGQSVTVTFSHADGLVAHGDKVQGFAIAGADKKFHWADAKIVGKTVVLSSPSVPSPVAVRYGWANNPVCNLYNGAGLPASPFRTDQW